MTVLLILLLASDKSNALECQAGFEDGTLEILSSSEPGAACSYRAYPCDFKRPCQFSLTKISSPEKLGRCTIDAFVECYCKSDKCNTNFELLLDSWVNSDVKNKTLLKCMTNYLEYRAKKAMGVMDDSEVQSFPRTARESASKHHPLRGKKDTELKTDDKPAQPADGGLIELPKTGQEWPPSADNQPVYFNRFPIIRRYVRTGKRKEGSVAASITSGVAITVTLLLRDLLSSMLIIGLQ